MAATFSVERPHVLREKRLFTAADLLSHPEWGPCELIRGKVLPVCRPNYNHGKLMTEISRQLANFCALSKVGSVVTGDSGVYLEHDPDTVRGPDVYFLSAAREPSKEKRDKYLEVAPELCVEIVSPKDRWSKILRKVNMYLNFGVQQVWVVDPQTRTAHVYRSGNAVSMMGADGMLSGEDVLPGFELSLKELFALLD